MSQESTTNLKKRKSLRLKEFDYRSDGAYYVTICTDKRNNLITAILKRILKRELLAVARRFHGVKIDYFIFMPNHCHIIFILRSSRVSLPRVIQVFKSITTVLIKRTGYEGRRFWQRNYYEHIIRSEEALHFIREYIRQNPELERMKFTKEGRPVSPGFKQA